MQRTPAIDETTLRQLPKVELHRHLEGTVRAETAHELAARNGVILPVDDLTTLYDYDDLAGFLEVLYATCAPFVTVDDYHRLAYESTLDAAAAGVVYTEIFVTPHQHLGRGVPFATLWSGVTRGLADAEHDTGVVSRVILNVDKRSGPGPALHLLDLAWDTTGYLIGLGGDGMEDGVDNTALAPAFSLAAERGLRRTLHAGEFSSRSVAEAIEVLGCERIDHGPLVLDDAELTARAAEQGIGFTLCPTSDVRISKVFPDLTDHTLPQLLDAGLLVTLNSDDPALLGHDVADEYAAVLGAGLADPGDLHRMAVNGVDASWLPEPERSRLRARISSAWNAVVPVPETVT